jgi:hypothetical protein
LRDTTVILAGYQEKKNGMAGDSTAEVPGPKVETENGWEAKRVY